MKKARILLLVFILAHQFTLAQDSLNYVIRFPNARHHEAEIILQLRNVREPSLILRMSQSSPGRYAMHQFAKNIYDISPTGNQKATIKRIAPEAWEVSDIKGSVDIRYTLFANRADGTYSGIDRDFAVLNMPSTLLWPENKLHLPVLVQFDLPDSINWRIATPLSVADSAKKQFTAPNLSYLMDSPCLLGNLKLREFYVAEDSVPRIRMALHTVANDAEIDILVEMAKKALAEQKEVFGEFPAFEDSTYTFLCGYGPGYYDDGMEHRNATMITSNIPLGGNQEWLIGTLSHEFFHVWNMERLRPASLEPFDFTRANISGELWFGEGFTSYYGDLALCRSGVLDTDKYLYTIGSTINYISNAPGWRYGSPVHMSEMATFTDQSSFVDETNFANTFISYYTYGEMIALALDLTLRSSFQDVSLDDYMKALWIKYGKNEKSYTNLDLMHTLGEVCGDKQFAHQFSKSTSLAIPCPTLPDFSKSLDTG
ncbi:MAG: M61 family metallopeptidase [Cyclobacteriaceae bacterium]|nr:M61 family metallopeptidase [Cyclobacteriaceae bacterium]